MAVAWENGERIRQFSSYARAHVFADVLRFYIFDYKFTKKYNFKTRRVIIPTWLKIG